MGTTSDGFSSGLTCNRGSVYLLSPALWRMCSVALAIGCAKIKPTTQKNESIVIFLTQEQFVNCLVKEGLWIKESFVQVFPLFTPAMKVVFFTVSLTFLHNELLVTDNSHYGNVVSVVKMIPFSCENTDARHVMLS